MSSDVYREALRLAGSIEDPYLRAITYAKIGYYMYRAKNPLYKQAFSRALSAIASIENPLFLVRALMEVGTFFARIGSKTADKVFHQAYDLLGTFPVPLRDELLGELVLRLIELGKPSDAVFYATEIGNPIKRNDILLKILHAHLKEGNLRKARKLLDAITEEPWHSIAAFEILKEHLRREEFGSAIRIISELESDYWLGEAMRIVASHLKKANVPPETYEKFVDIALGMPPEKQSWVLKSLLVGMAVQGEVDLVLGVLRRLGEKPAESISLEIIPVLADRPGILLQFVRDYPFNPEAIYAKVMDELLEKKLDEEHVEVVRLVGEKTTSERTLVKVVRYLSKLHSFDDAWEFASRIRDPYLRSLAFGGIAVEKLKENDIDGAIDAALEVRDKRWGSWLLAEILTKILELQTGESVSEDLEHSAERQRALWEKG
jgi:hypothetical protein